MYTDDILVLSKGCFTNHIEQLRLIFSRFCPTPLSGRYERARDAFQRCLALRSSNRQHQLQSPVEGLTSTNLLQEFKRVPTSSLPHSLCAYQNLVREKRTAWESKTPTQDQYGALLDFATKTPFSLIQDGIVVKITKRKDQESQAHHTSSGQAQQANTIDPTNHGRSKERRVWHASRIRGERVETTIRHVHPTIERIHEDEHNENCITSSLTI